MSDLRFLLDTNIVIGLLKGPGPARDLLDRHGALPASSAVSQIRRIELLSFHALSVEEEERIRALLASLSVIPLDDRIEQETIALRRRFRLKLPDALIGATARTHRLALITLDEQLAATTAQR
jgi:predicted nucleic acid-binding protein